MPTCTATPTVTLGDDEMALRINFPVQLDAVQPLGNPEQSPYNIGTALEMQISSWLPNLYRANYRLIECQIIVTTRKQAYYLLNTYPEYFTIYVNP